MQTTNNTTTDNWCVWWIHIKLLLILLAPSIVGKQSALLQMSILLFPYR
jgi:hypothetical protein